MAKITSWNVNSLKVRGFQVLQYLEEADPCVLGLQELKQCDDAVNRDPFEEKGWHIITHGQKTYNGVALISKKAPREIRIGIPGNEEDPQARAIAATYGDLRVLNVYVPNGKAVGDKKYAYKLEWLARLRDYVEQLLIDSPQLLVIGDFNIAPGAIDVHDPLKWQDKILCSAAERKALTRLLDTGLRDAYREKYPRRKDFSWWDYRAHSLRRNLGLRIDLTLISQALVGEDAGIDIAPRKHEHPSDHAPVWVKVR